MITVIANLKGGTGKSTVAFNLLMWLAHRRVSTFAVDLDPQCTLADVMQVRREEGYQPLPELSTEIGSISTWRDRVEEMVIDVGPSDLPTMYAAVLQADRIVLPVPPSQADVWSTQRFTRKVLEMRGSSVLPHVHAFVNRADTHQAVRESDETFEALKTIDGLQVLSPRLKQRMAFRRSFSEGLSVEELERRGKAARELGELAKHLYPSVARRKPQA